MIKAALAAKHSQQHQPALIASTAKKYMCMSVSTAVARAAARNKTAKSVRQSDDNTRFSRLTGLKRHTPVAIRVAAVPTSWSSKAEGTFEIAWQAMQSIARLAHVKIRK